MDACAFDPGRALSQRNEAVAAVIPDRGVSSVTENSRGFESKAKAFHSLKE